ncbi:ectoine hydroxylase [Streptomyces sp. WMMB 714]|uniref:phytanoyl-CoA dioxygenase family protein n=1 Tax=Streptomyces sp. WMMB 714 TaxID=1286822 RepID=UPI0005F8956C|nr:phytanoyl-CoA dioxygenase family protein [Streptomyces sp. WMMB 714]SCK10235.1 ectoine hydroxylase [Streptomyces sp. WMMB 714]
MSVSVPPLGTKVRYGRDGWLPLPHILSDTDLKKLVDRIDGISAQRRPEVVHEEGSSAVRALHGCHDFDEVCARLVRLPALVGFAEELLGGPVYVYQFKVNMKQAHEGAAWPWHQDFAFWHHEDGMAAPDAVNIAIFLNDVTDENGPLEVIPGSQHGGIFEDGTRAGQHSHDWHDHVSAKLEYTVPDDIADELAGALGVKRLTGSAGTAVAFHPSIVHSSSNNLSAERRCLLLITYNRIGNAPANPTRPAFLVGRDSTPLVAADGNSL